MVASATAFAVAPMSEEQDLRERVNTAFAEFYPAIAGACFRVLKDEDAAEDASQDAFLSAWEHIETFRGDASLKTWVTRIAINASCLALRKMKAMRSERFQEIFTGGGEILNAQDVVSDRGTDVLSELLQRESSRQFELSLGELRPIDQGAIRAKLEGMSHEEAARHLSISVSALKSRLTRARAKLEKKLCAPSRPSL